MTKTFCGSFVAMLALAGGMQAASIFAASDPGSTPGEFDTATLTINSNSAMVNGSFDVRDMFGGSFGVNQAIFFDDDGTARVYSVTFTTNTPVSIEGYDLYLGNDGNDIYRSASRFQLYQGADATGTLLSDVAISTTYNATYGSNIIRVNDTFAPVSAAQFTAYFYGGTSTYNGVRVLELDAILTPEPATIQLLGLAGAGLLWLRRRQRHQR